MVPYREKERETKKILIVHSTIKILKIHFLDKWNYG